MKCHVFFSSAEIARVIAPYVATGTGQLSLETGNLINVRQKSPRGWWEGELQVFSIDGSIVVSNSEKSEP